LVPAAYSYIVCAGPDYALLRGVNLVVISPSVGDHRDYRNGWTLIRCQLPYDIYHYYNKAQEIIKTTTFPSWLFTLTHGQLSEPHVAQVYMRQGSPS
jgi:hypothetical protein